MAVEDDTVQAGEAEERDRGGELVDDEDVEGSELAGGGPVGGGSEGVRGWEEEPIQGGEESGEVVEEYGEEELKGEVKLAEDGANDIEPSGDRGREQLVAENMNFESACEVGFEWRSALR